MRKKINILTLLMSLFPFVGSAASLSVSLTIPPGAQADIPLSNTNPNFFEVPGDRITGVTSSAGMLTAKSNTPAGGAFVSTAQEKPFTLYMTTEGGQTFSFNARPQKVPGRSYRVAGMLPVNRDEAKKWEESQPYESMLVSLNKSLRQGQLPDGYASVTTENTSLRTPSGVRAVAQKAWAGNALQVVHWHVTNQGTLTTPLREQDFWKKGVRAVMFDTGLRELSGSSSTGVWVTSSQEAGDGEY